MQRVKPKWIKSQVILKERQSEKVFRVRFGLQSESGLNSGQFMNIKVADRIQRSYSISSLPGEEYLETFVDISPGGPGSKFFENLSEGDSAEILYPLGNFVYTEKETPVYFVATGTGITPFVSMIKYALEVKKSKRPIRLLFGLRYYEHVFLDEMFKKLEKKYPNLGSNFSYCISRGSESKEKEREVPNCFDGRVTKYLQENGIEDNSDVYICGGKKMIEEVEKIALQNGIDKTNIFYEQYY